MDSDEDEEYDVPDDLAPMLIDGSKVDKTKRRVFLGAGSYGKVETIWYGGDQCVIKTMLGTGNVDGFMKEARFLFQERLNINHAVLELILPIPTVNSPAGSAPWGIDKLFFPKLKNESKIRSANDQKFRKLSFIW